MSNKYRGNNSRQGMTDRLADKYLVNEEINANELLVIDSEGNKQGPISKQHALNIASEQGLDLVQVGANGPTVIAKIMDFGKFLYTKKKQLAESKKHQKIIQVKEIKMRPNIGDQDYKTKMKHAISFLREGKKVKFTLQFRGRQMIIRGELGKKMFERIRNDIDREGITNLVEEKDQKSGPFWTKIYFVK